MTVTARIAPIIPLDEAGPLDWLWVQPGGRFEATATELGRRWGWHRQRVGRQLAVWAKASFHVGGTLLPPQAQSRLRRPSAHHA